MRKNPSSSHKGFALAEMLVYIAILIVMVGAIITTLVGILSAGREIAVVKTIDTSSTLSLERMVREIRNADTIDVGNSTLGAHPGILTLDGVDSGGSARSVSFSITSNELHFSENSVDRGPVTLDGARVTNLVFYKIDNEESEAVTIEMTIESGAGDLLKSETFNATAVLRGSY